MTSSSEIRARLEEYARQYRVLMLGGTLTTVIHTARVGGSPATLDIRDIEDLLAALASAEARITKALSVKHGPFGPWDDDLCDYDAVVAALTERTDHE